MELTKKLITDWVDVEHKEEKLGFFCAPLTAPQYMNCSQAMAGDAAIMAIRYAVRDWRGITKEGAPLKFTPRNLESLFADASLIELLGELGGKIIERSILTEEERKNS